jgi:putative transposase
VKNSWVGAARRKGQYRIQTIKSLDGALLVNAEDSGIHGRFEIQPDDVRGLLLKLRTIAGHVAARTLLVSRWLVFDPLPSSEPAIEMAVFARRRYRRTVSRLIPNSLAIRRRDHPRGHFPSDDAATKLIYLALRDITKKLKNPPVTWKLAATQFAIRFGQRFFAMEI